MRAVRKRLLEASHGSHLGVAGKESSLFASSDRELRLLRAENVQLQRCGLLRAWSRARRQEAL